MTYYIYFLKSKKDGNFYIGKTNNIDRRLKEHNAGQVQSTKSRRPFLLLGYETCKTEEESIMLEKEWKKGYKREELKKRFNSGGVA
ncbi:MAG: GIY-YIG nuclease family protein [Patescibacteria group bacterium]